MKALFWTPIMLAAALFSSASVLAGESHSEHKMMIKLATDGAQVIEADVSNLAVGESETFVTDSGSTVDIIRTQDGAEVYIDGELVDMGDMQGLHEHGVVVHSDSDIELECFSDGDEEVCEREMIFISDDGDLEVLDGDNVKVFTKRVEVVCDENEECEENVWVSDGEDHDFETLHDGSDGHKVIKIKKHVISDSAD